MELRERNFLERRLGFLRQSVMALGKLGKSKDYYLDNLDAIVKEARYIATKLKLEKQEELEL